MAKRVLVVDNDRVCVEIIGDILSQAGYTVGKVYDGMEALEALDCEPPDIVFLDMILPKIDGDRVFHYMKANPRTSQIPVVILSGTLAEDREKLLALGAHAYVAKGPRDGMRQNILAALRCLTDGPPGQTPAILGLETAVTRSLVRELLAIKRHKEAILQTVSEGVVEVDGRHRMLSVNRTGLEILLRPEAELVGAHAAGLLGVELRPVMEHALARFMADPGHTNDGTTLGYRDRVLRIAFARIALEEPAGGYFIILRDVTDQARKIEELSALNARLQAVDQMRSELLTMLSHDLHTPLTAIKGSLDVLLHESVGIELRQELLGIAQKNTDRLFRMVSDILDLARIEAGRYEIRREPFDVVATLRVTIDRLRRLAQDKEIALTLQAPDGISPVPADGLRMEQVFTNLLGNALKFTPRSGQISVTVRELATELLVEVRDSGGGISAEHRERIFDRFYRVPRPPGEEVEGSGLGLSICKAIVEEHGGRIWVESVVGHGSTFCLTLPKSPPAP